MSGSFKKNKYCILKKAISRDLAIFLYNYLITKRQLLKVAKEERWISLFDDHLGTFGDKQVNNPNTYVVYGDPAFDTLLLSVQSLLEKTTNLKLLPTYSYCRFYTKGDILHRHKDRAECAFSTTLNLGGDEWPIFLEPRKNIGIPGQGGATMQSTNKGIKVTLSPGDMLVYSGEILEHWREPLEGDQCGQVFLHFTEASNTNLLYDGRKILGAWEKAELKF